MILTSPCYTVTIHLDFGLENLKKTVDEKHPTIVALQAWGDPDENGNFDWKSKWDDGTYLSCLKPIRSLCRGNRLR